MAPTIPPRLPLLIHARLVLPDRVLPEGWLLVEEGRVAALGTRIRKPKAAVVIEAPGKYLAPGFIDLHVHGGAGADYMDGTPEAVRTANRAHLRHGTTTIFPTTTTGAPAEIARMLTACGAVRESWTPADGARIGGVHLYGPYFAEDKVGCHSKAGRRAPEVAEYQQYLRSGLVKIATCAAELPGAEKFYRAARAAGCLVTCGHSNASWTEMARAFAAGMRHVDHFWCAMSSVPSLRARWGTPMQGSMEQFVLAEPEMSTEVIADGEHLAPELLRFAWKMKGASRLCLVTDANRALDCPPGRYRFGPQESGEWFESNGRVGLVPGVGLASSIRALDHMVRTMVRAGVPLEEAVRMASLTPAERVGLGAEVGSLEKGKRADLVLLDERLQVRQVWVDGAAVSLKAARRSGLGKQVLGEAERD
ncbi:MAG: N-acetylglucosamine-6-phosphate deacetylase [Acidobacteria bacterium]|nr:N-acetylglucosamine-6-phosphate deacetylase [Acidobacteriota bacterium]